MTTTRTMPRILVVDDDLATRQVARSALANAGFDVRVARDGAEALTRLRGGRFDLMLLDVWMPRMDGLDASRTLKKLQHPPQIVLFTINKDRVTDSDADSAGLAAVIEKSEGLEPLLQQVQLLLQPAH